MALIVITIKKNTGVKRPRRQGLHDLLPQNRIQTFPANRVEGAADIAQTMQKA